MNHDTFAQDRETSPGCRLAVDDRRALMRLGVAKASLKRQREKAQAVSDTLRRGSHYRDSDDDDAADDDTAPAAAAAALKAVPSVHSAVSNKRRAAGRGASGGSEASKAATSGRHSGSTAAATPTPAGDPMRAAAAHERLAGRSSRRPQQTASPAGGGGSDDGQSDVSLHSSRSADSIAALIEEGYILSEDASEGTRAAAARASSSMAVDTVRPPDARDVAHLARLPPPARHRLAEPVYGYAGMQAYGEYLVATRSRAAKRYVAAAARDPLPTADVLLRRIGHANVASPLDAHALLAAAQRGAHADWDLQRAEHAVASVCSDGQIDARAMHRWLDRLAQYP